MERKKPAVLPLSERRRVASPANNGGDRSFHVIHKVPASDSPYGRAKHVQLIDKDPCKAISLFWAAINAGDRVDSALKDMAVVMKQLDRSDEAIEAIKSFRHLCPLDTQDSLDNVLVELYKRSGRVEEEIEMLQTKLRSVEEGTIFGGKRTKIARSQGKKILITIEQEKARKALSLEPDKNKQCNLAICLIRMNRISEAKALLQEVKASSGNEQMDESYSKSYERAYEMLIQVESQSLLEPVAQKPDKGREIGRSLASCGDRSLKEASMFLPRNEDKIYGFMDRRRLPYACPGGQMLSDEQNSESYRRNYLEKNDNFSGYDDRSSNCTPIGLKSSVKSSAQTTFTEKWRKASCLESPCEGSVYSIKLNENWGYSPGQEAGSAHKKSYASSAASRKNSEGLFTQPRRCSWGFNNSDQRKGRRWAEDTVRNSVRKLSFEHTLTSESVPLHSIQNLNEELQASSNGKSENLATGQVEEEVQEGLSGVLLTQPRMNNRDQRRVRWAEVSADSFAKTTTNMNSHSAKDPNGGEPLVSPTENSEKGLEKPANTPNKKSWADMVEEEEELQSGGKHLGKSYCLNMEEEFNDENRNSNIVYPDSKDHIDMKSGNSASVDSVSSRINRLQVFRDITSP
ncbi:Tetratricopeptide-like helical [Corchorus olitorius]|uniref:Tetratricopeptide-like helical n=1 Tax=Corchorus olitorius TaxID=93759 RepID=A0A1R3JV69_9ROSI|nr:Tetratricopeptide-like helical [Corchorus olitorius]